MLVLSRRVGERIDIDGLELVVTDISDGVASIKFDDLINLTGGKGASVVLPPCYEIHICRVKGGSVRIGIVAPRDIKVLRSEMLNDANGLPKKIKLEEAA